MSSPVRTSVTQSAIAFGIACPVRLRSPLALIFNRPPSSCLEVSGSDS